MSELDHYLTVCEKAARAGGQILNDWRDKICAREKAPRDLVTEADLASQRAIEQVVLGSFPGHGFVGEECLPDATPTGGGSPERQYRWIVDPLDGTANYVHGLLPFCVSVALARGADVIVGVVLDPVRDECYMAQLGGGAWLNGKRLQVSGCQRLSQALVASSFSSNVGRQSEEISRFVEVVVECQSLRRLGSAALNLCYLAAGRLDAYWATGAKSWDVAAGVLMAKEAGGTVTSVDGTPFRLDNPLLAVAATTELHAEFVRVLRRGAP